MESSLTRLKYSSVPAKPKLVARDSAPGQSAWKKRVPSISDDGLTPVTRPYLSYALWQVHENIRWDALQLPGKSVFLLSDSAEIQLFSKKAGLKCRGTAALQSDLHALIKRQIDTNVWGELEQDFGPRDKSATLTSAEKGIPLGQFSASKSANNSPPPATPVEAPTEHHIKGSVVLEEALQCQADGRSDVDAHGLQQSSIEAQATFPTNEGHAGKNTIRPWSEIVKPRSLEGQSVEITTDHKGTSRKENSNSGSTAAEEAEVPNPVSAPAPALDVPAPIPTKSPWKKLPPPMPEPVTALSTTKPPSKDIVQAEKIEKQNFIANWVNNVQPPTQNVQLKRRSHHRNKSSESKPESKPVPAATEEVRPHPSAIMKRPATHSTSSSKEQIGALTPPLTPQMNGTFPPSVVEQIQSPTRHSVKNVEPEDSDDEVIVFNPRAKRFSSGERAASKNVSPKRPLSSGRLLRPEFPSPKAPARLLAPPNPEADEQDIQLIQPSPPVNHAYLSTEDSKEEATPLKDTLSRGPQNPPANRNVSRNGPSRPPHYGRTQRARQPVVPVVIDPDDFGRRSLIQTGGSRGMPNGHRGGFQNGYGRGSSPRGSPHPATRQTDPDVDFVLKSGSTRGSTRGRGKLWVP